ncbi:MAG: MarR family winged helix-turn-helix transcriptional regulator [Longimicrobiales bacterium]
MKQSARGKGKRAVSPATSRQAFQVADRLHSAAIHLLRRLRREDTATGLPAPQLSALSVIVLRGPLTLGALADAEQVRPPTMTRVVAALEQAGLIERRTSPDDGRVAFIRATTRGRDVLTEGRLRRVEALARQLADLPAQDRHALVDALDVLEQLVGSRASALPWRGGQRSDVHARIFALVPSFKGRERERKRIANLNEM